MSVKQILRLTFVIAITLFIFQACQKDYNKPKALASIIGTRDSVYINSITLINFPDTTPAGATWDHLYYIAGADSTDTLGAPDIFFSITDNNGATFWRQPSHFGNVGAHDTVTYFLTTPFQVPYFGWQFKVNFSDWDSIVIFTPDTIIYSQLMGYLTFTLTPGDTLNPNPYPSYVTSEILGGPNVTLGLIWK